MKKICVLLAMMALAVAVLTACGSKNNSTNSTVSPTGTAVSLNMYHPCGGEMKLGQYKGLTFTKEAITVTDEDIDNQIKLLLKQYPNYAKDETRDNTEVKEGDVLNIDYVGKVGDVAFDGGTASDYFLEIGSGTFIDGFESSLIGKTVGTTVDINVTFPDPYPSNTAMSGAKSVFTVTINYVGQKTDEIDDAYVKRYTTVATTVAELRAYLNDLIKKDKEEDQEEKMWDSLVTQAIANSEYVKIAQDDIDYYYNSSMNTLEQYSTYYGYSKEQIVSMMTGGTTTYEEYLQTLKEEAEQSVKEFMLLQEIAKAEGLTVTPEQYALKAEEYRASVSAASIAELESKLGRDYIEYCVLTDMALQVIKENAVITEAE